MDHPHPPAPAAAGGAAAGDNDVPACCWWVPLVSRRGLAKAQLGLAVAAAAFALFASTLGNATISSLPARCVATAEDILVLRYKAAVLLLWAMAQAGAAAAALIIVPPSLAGRLFRGASNILGLNTFGHIVGTVLSTLYVTGGLCFGGSVQLILAAIFAGIFLYIITSILWLLGLPRDP